MNETGAFRSTCGRVVCSALHAACCALEGREAPHAEECVKLLLAAGAKADLPLRGAETLPLVLCLRSSEAEAHGYGIAKLLLEAGAPINESGTDGIFPLVAALMGTMLRHPWLHTKLRQCGAVCSAPCCADLDEREREAAVLRKWQESRLAARRNDRRVACTPQAIHWMRQRAALGPLPPRVASHGASAAPNGLLDALEPLLVAMRLRERRALACVCAVLYNSLRPHLLLATVLHVGTAAASWENAAFIARLPRLRTLHIDGEGFVPVMDVPSLRSKQRLRLASADGKQQTGPAAALFLGALLGDGDHTVRLTDNMQMVALAHLRTQQRVTLPAANDADLAMALGSLARNEALEQCDLSTTHERRPLWLTIALEKALPAAVAQRQIGGDFSVRTQVLLGAQWNRWWSGSGMCRMPAHCACAEPTWSEVKGRIRGRMLEDGTAVLPLPVHRPTSLRMGL